MKLDTREIWLFARDPGGANAIIPLIEPLQTLGYSTRLWGKQFSLSQYKYWHISAQDINVAAGGSDEADVAGFIKHKMPKLVITGTSMGDDTDKWLWQAAKERHIPTIAILDQWLNYAPRFQLCDHRLIFPDYVMVMDKTSRKGMLNLGLDPQRVIISGQPYYEFLSDQAALFPHRPHALDRMDILFVSEPIRRMQQPDTYYYNLGYTEVTIFQALLQACLNLPKNTKVTITIKPHPKEQVEEIEKCTYPKMQSQVTVNYALNQHVLDLIGKTDLVVGMTSSVLLDAYILQVPTLSVQIGLQKKDESILNRLSGLESIRTQPKLTATIRRAHLHPDSVVFTPISLGTPIKKIVNFIQNRI